MFLLGVQCYTPNYTEHAAERTDEVPARNLCSDEIKPSQVLSAGGKKLNYICSETKNLSSRRTLPPYSVRLSGRLHRSVTKVQN